MIQYAELLTFREAFYLTEAGKKYLKACESARNIHEILDMDLVDGVWQLSTTREGGWWWHNSENSTFDFTITFNWGTK